MGTLLKTNFKTKLTGKLKNFNSKNPEKEYHAEVFKELFSGFPQFKAHVAAYVERNYCIVINDEDHGDPCSLFNFLSPDEIKMLNEWIVTRGNQTPPVQRINNR